MFRPSAACCLGVFLFGITGAPLRAADAAQVNAAIERGRSSLNTQLPGLSAGPKSLAAYALLKTGSKPDDPTIQEALAEAVKAATDVYASGKRPPGADADFAHREFAYTVVCHLLLLEAADPKIYKPQLESLAAFLSEQQLSNGSWCYVNTPFSDAGDTSQLQFALLGLWAAIRADVDVPNQTLQKAAQWLLRTQLGDGGFAYQPVSGEKPDQKEYRFTTTVAGVGSLLLVRHVFFAGNQFGEDIGQMTRPKKKHGVLERLQDEQERKRRTGEIHITTAALDKGIARGLKIVDARFSVGPAKPFNCQTYLLYSMERTAALLDSDLLGKHDWYAEASDELLRLQLADGSWSDQTGTAPATSFGLLCLTKATAKILGKPPGKKVGGGLLAGARGLPDDLSKLQMKDGQAVARKSLGSVDDLLAELENTQNVSVEDVQKAILEAVDLDHPEQLVGEIDRLRRLASDPRAEVRRTALWAVGRSGDIRLAPLLIAGLKDVDVDVIREASFGLAVLSRKPTGLIDDNKQPVSIEPLEGVEEDASEESRQQRLNQWLAQAESAWKKWYFSVRPYHERDDRQQLQKKR